MLNTDDDILICDPEGEYAPLVEAMGDLGSVIRVSAGGRDRLNAMYMVDGYGENNPIVVKSEFIMSLIEQIDKKGVGPQHKSIIDRCITNVYRNAADAGTIPTLCTLRDMLLEQPEPEAKQIALSLELYTTGSLDILYGVYGSDDMIVQVALSQIGNVGGEPYWSWYGFGSRVEWCACFVSWCADQCGYIDTGVIPKYAGCDNGMDWFKERGHWADNSVEPSPGMIIFFDWAYNGQDGTADHTGIVERVENGIVYTVEGNTSDSCAERHYAVGHSEILGYGMPAY